MTAEIPRSIRAGRGELAGPAATARQVRRVPGVTIEEVSPGVLQFSAAFGWKSGHVRNAVELARVVSSLFTEAQVAAYSRWRGRQYDLAPEPEDAPQCLTASVRRRRPERPGSRPDVYDPRDWRIDDDGKWIDPGTGRRWRPESAQVQRVQDKREELGLARIPDQATPPRGLLRGESV
jgi:hypothetical protein